MNFYVKLKYNFRKILVIKSFWNFLSIVQKLTFIISIIFTLTFLYYIYCWGFNNYETLLLISLWFPFSYILDYINNFNKYTNDLKQLRLTLSALKSFYLYDIKKYNTDYPFLNDVVNIKCLPNGNYRYKKRKIKILDIMEVRNTLVEMINLIKKIDMNTLTFNERMCVELLKKHIKFELTFLKKVPKYSYQDMKNYKYKISPHFSLDFDKYFNGHVIQFGQKTNIIKMYKKYFYPSYG